MSAPESMMVDERKAVDAVRIFRGVGGLVAVVLGALILFNPLVSGAVMMEVIAIMLAIYLVAAGVVFLGSMIFSKTMTGWHRAGNALLGLLYLIAGIIVFGNIGAAAAVLAAGLSIFLGIVWIFEGIMAFVAMKGSPSKVWSVIYGIISILAGFVLAFSPLLGAVTLWMLLGASLLVMGIIQVVRAFTTKSVR